MADETHDWEVPASDERLADPDAESLLNERPEDTPEDERPVVDDVNEYVIDEDEPHDV